MDEVFKLALQYGNGKLTDVGIAWAMEKLGLDQQTQNPEYTYGMPFTSGKLNFNPLNMLKRAGIKAAISGGGLPLLAGAGAIYFLNKNRKRFTGYDTQKGWEDARTERRANKRLDRITDRMLSGKNYGNYEEALLDSGAGAVKIDDNIISGADYFPTYTPKAAKDPLEKFESIEDITRTDIPDRGRGQDNVSISPSRTISKAPSRQSRYTSGPGGLHSNYSRGGIAGLWRR